MGGELLDAIASGYLEKMRYLLDQGADVNGTDHDGVTALMIASQAGKLEFVRELLARGAKVDVRNKFGGTALMWGGGRSFACGDFALGKRRRRGRRTCENRTGLMFATQKGYADVVRKLLDQGADVNAQNVFCRTPLMMAARHGYAEVVRDLLDRGADPAVKNNEGDTAWMIATKKGYEEIAQLLASSRR